MRKIYLLTVLIFSINIVHAQEIIKYTPKVSKNAFYLQGAINGIEDLSHNNAQDLSLDLSYSRTFDKLFSADIGVRYDNTSKDIGSVSDRFSLYLGGGVDVKLFNELYLVPKINIGMTQAKYSYWRYINGVVDIDSPMELIEGKEWNLYLGIRLNIEYRFESWRVFTGIDYENAFDKFYNFAAKIGVGYSF